MLMDKKLDPPYKSGFLFIDSTEHGKTMYKVLKYAIKKGFKKVLVIDPRHINELGYVTPINPLDYDAPSEAMSSHIMDSLRVLWTSKFQDESIITKYAPYLVEALHHGGFTLPDIETFIVPALVNQREQVMDTLKDGRPLRFVAKEELKRIYKDRMTEKDVQPTLRRFEPFRHTVMKLMLGSKEGIDFQKLISEGWIILCNLHPGGLFDLPQQKLLGTVLINEIIRAKQRMKGHTVPFHIYIDEFGHYATSKIEQILMYERHLNIYLTLAHQGFFQIDDSRIKSAVKAGCKCKFLFYTPDDKDLYEMIALMYGGELTDREVKSVLSGLRKQQAAIKIGKQPSRVCDLRNWPDVPITDKQVDEWLKAHFKSNPQLYRPTADVWGEITHRFATNNKKTEEPIRRNNLASEAGSDTKTAKRGKRNDSSTAGKSNTVRGVGKEREPNLDKAEAAGGETGKDVRISPDLRADYSDAKPFRKRRTGSEEQGGKREGGES